MDKHTDVLVQEPNPSFAAFEKFICRLTPVYTEHWLNDFSLVQYNNFVG